MRIETIFDRVPGCGDLKKAKRAANKAIANWHRTRRRENRGTGDIQWVYDTLRRMYRRQAMLKP